MQSAGQDKINRVWVVLKKIPLTLKRTGVGEFELIYDRFDPVAAAINALQTETDCPYKQFCWIGHVSGLSEVPENEKATFSEKLKEHNIYQVPLEDKTRSHWERFCKSVLWPLLNSQFGAGTGVFEYDLWNEYKTVNNSYADLIGSLLAQHPDSKTDLIWIQDYHLLLLPSILRKKIGLLNRVGFFSHAPFPTSELFRLLPVRSKLLRGVLGSDLIGFQTYHDCRHFLSCCTRVLALDAGPKGVVYHGHKVEVDIYPVGIDPSIVQSLLDKPEVQTKTQEIRNMFPGKKIIVGRDRLDPIKGIPQKLLSFDTFLTTHPEWQGKVVLFQICLPPREEKRSEVIQKLTSQINELVGTINGRLSTADFTPIHYLNKDISLEEICALFAASDAALITPLRDGMNLSAHEYTMCQQQTHSPLILSEFAGSAQSLGGALLVNPWDQDGVVAALHEALNMSQQEKDLKHEHNFQYVTRHTALIWLKSYLKELNSVEIFEKLPILKDQEVLAEYSKCKKRLFLLDYDGTLTPIVPRPEEAIPSTSLLNSLQALASDPRNIVYVISGRSRKSLDKWLGGLNIGLTCEHGLFLKCPKNPEEISASENNEISSWIETKPELDTSWKEVLLPIIQDYTERTPGSSIEEKEINLVWHYRNVSSAEHAEFQAKELVVHLQNVASKLAIDVLMGKKAVEIRPQGVNKGVILRKILNMHDDVDFVFCAGDDTTDEDMFVALNEWNENNSVTCFSCVVSKIQDSHATFYIGNQPAVLKLLKSLAELK